ncbi:MAG: hypothetical protein ABH863_04010 [Candidatus Micrarchaeota archaeon]
MAIDIEGIHRELGVRFDNARKLPRFVGKLAILNRDAIAIDLPKELPAGVVTSVFSMGKTEPVIGARTPIVDVKPLEGRHPLPNGLAFIHIFGGQKGVGISYAGKLIGKEKFLLTHIGDRRSEVVNLFHKMEEPRVLDLGHNRGKWMKVLAIGMEVSRQRKLREKRNK